MVTRSLVSDQVFRELSEGILAGRHAPGEKLPTQRALAADLGVNMASVREAVKRLEQIGLVDVRHGDAMRVRDWRTDASLDVVAHLLFAAGGVHTGTLAAVLEARRLMLQEAARLAAGRRSESAASRLAGIAASIAAAGEQVAAQALDFAFMAELVDAADNVVFTLILNTVRRVYFEHAGAFGAAVGGEQLRPLYRRAAAAVAARDGHAAAAAVAELAGEQERLVLGAVS